MTGGVIAKLGNLFEAKGAVDGLLRVISGEAFSVRYESIIPEDHGVDWFLRYQNKEEAVQAKRSSTSGKWTITVIEREGVLKSAIEWLRAGIHHTFTFVSESSTPEMNYLCESAKHAMDARSLMSVLSQHGRNDFEHLCSLWEVSSDTALGFLKRCRFEVLTESHLDELIKLRGGNIFKEPVNTIFPILRAFIEEHMGLELTADKIKREFAQCGTLSFKPRLDPALWKRLREANQFFDESHPLFGASSPIHRSETVSIIEALSDVEGPRIILLTGNAGSGKSFILKEVIADLDRKAIPHLAFRIDKYLTARSLDELGRFVLGRDENPLMTLVDYAGNKPSVLIIDQVDAIGQISGRSGPIRELVLSLLRSVHAFSSVRVIAACRSYDLSNDPVLKEYTKDKSVLSIQAALLKWADDVEPLLLERGFDVSKITLSMRSILTSPLNLCIFLELGAEQNFSSLCEITNLSTLYERLIQKKSEHLTAQKTMAELAKIARRMSDDQALDVPEAILEPSVISALASEQLILRAKSRISFFHETFFDYVYARDFVGAGRSILEFLKKDEQILFRRTQVRQILTYYRQTGGASRSRYFKELEEVLNSSNVRYHIKDGIASWIGSIADPGERELDLILKLDTPDYGMPFLVRKALYPQPFWASILARRGILDHWLRSPTEARRNDAIAILTTLLKTDQAMAVDILRSYGQESPTVRLTIIRHWLLFADDIEPAESLIQFICEVISHDIDTNNGQDSLEHIIPYSWRTRYPEIAGRLFSAFFSAWFETHPDEHPFSNNRRDIVPEHVFDKLKETNIEIYLNTVLPIFLATIERVNKINAGCISDYTLYRIHESHGLGFDGFFRNIRSGLAQLSKTNPDKATEFLRTIDPRTHATCLYLHLSTLASGGAELAGRLQGLLNIPGIMEAGPSGASWLPFANAVKATIPFLDPDVRERIEAMILGYWPELSHASHVLRRLREGDVNPFINKESACSELKHSGNSQWAILKTIGVQCFSPLARIRFELLDRKFTGTPIPEPDSITFRWVPPPISHDRVQHMSDFQWLRAINNYQSETVSQRKQRKSFYEMHSGAFGLSQELREQAKSAPERFTRLFMKLPVDANPEYGNAILHSLADSKVDVVILLQIFSRLNKKRNPDFCSGFCQMISARPELALVDDAFDLLCWYVENGPVPSSGELEKQRIQQDMFKIEQLLDGLGGMILLHGDRAAAVRALAYVIAHCIERREPAVEVLKARLVNEEAQCIRFALSEPVLYALETLPDRRDAIGFVEKLVKKAGNFDPYPLTSYHGVLLLHRLLYLFPKECLGLVEDLMGYPDEQIQQIGIYFAYYQTYISTDYKDRFADLLDTNKKFNYIDAGLAAQFIVEDHTKDVSIKKLIDYFNDPDEETRKSAIQCFRFLNNKPIEPYRKLLNAYLQSPAFAQASFLFYEFIKNASDYSRDIVIVVGERILELLTSNTDGDFKFDMTTIGEMLNKEYAGTCNEPESRIRILDLIDGMLQVGMYGVDQIIEEHERR